MSTLSISILERLVILRRKEVGNPRDFFAKSFTEYREGFEHNGTLQSMFASHWNNPDPKFHFLGESWIGLEKLHRLTSEHSYGLKIIMTDFDKKKYVAFYNQFKVSSADGIKLTTWHASE